MHEEENPLETVLRRISPSPRKVNGLPSCRPFRLMNTIPEKPIIEPSSLRAVNFSSRKNSVEMRIAVNTFTPIRTAERTPLVCAMPI